MSQKSMTEIDPERMRDYRRGALRSAFVSLFWSVIQDKKQKQLYKLQALADTLGIHKSTVSRWFSPDMPNWEVDTIADIADALGLEIQVIAKDRETGILYSPSGPVVGNDRRVVALTNVHVLHAAENVPDPNKILLNPTSIRVAVA